MNPDISKDVLSFNFPDWAQHYFLAKTGNPGFIEEHLPLEFILLLYRIDEIMHQQIGSGMLKSIRPEGRSDEEGMKDWHSIP